MKPLMIFSVLVFNAVFTTAVYANEFANQYPNGNDVREIVFQGDYAWSATYGSLVRWDKRDGSYIQYTTDNGLASNNVEDVLIGDDGKLWIATTGGVNIYDGQIFETLTPDNSGLMSDRVFCVTQSNDGTFWFGTKIGISTLDGDSWESYSIDDMVPDHRAGGYVDDIVIDNNEVVWAVVMKYAYGSEPKSRRYLTSYDGVAWKVHNGPDGALLVLNVESIAVDTNNNLWAATRGDGFIGTAYTFDGASWTDTGITSVHDIDVTQDGIVYLARGDYMAPVKDRKDDKYITTFDGSSFVDLPISDLLGYPVLAFFQVFTEENGTIWFRVLVGSSALILYSYDGENVRQHTTIGPLSYRINNMIVDDSNTKWVATTYGVSRYDDITWENIIFNVTSEERGMNPIESAMMLANYIYDLAIDKEGTLWLGTNLGTRSYDGNGGTLYNYSNLKHLNKLDRIVHVAVDDNNVKWFANSRALFRYDDETWTEFSMGPLEYTYFFSMEVDHDNVLWFGVGFADEEKNLQEGVVSFDGENWTHYNIDNSPLRGVVAVIAIADDNTKWIGTDTGYYSFDGTTWKSYEHIKNASYAGHQTVDIYIDNDGIVWFMAGGLHSFDGENWDDHGKKIYGLSHFLVDNNDDIWIISPRGAGFITSFSKASIRTDVAESDEVPTALAISGNYPNPFNPSTTIDFTIDKAGFGSLVVYNSMGQKVRTLMAEHMNPGVYNTVWNGRDDSGRAVSSGVYISRLKIGEQVTAKQMMLLK